MNSLLKAIISISSDQKSYQRWRDFFERMIVLEKDKFLKKVLSHPSLNAEQRCSILDEILAQDEQQISFIRLLEKEGLLYSGKKLLQRFDALKENKDKVLSGTIKSNLEQDGKTQVYIESEFSKRLGKQVSLTWEQDLTCDGIEAKVGSYSYSLTMADVISGLKDTLLRG